MIYLGRVMTLEDSQVGDFDICPSHQYLYIPIIYQSREIKLGGGGGGGIDICPILFLIYAPDIFANLARGYALPKTKLSNLLDIVILIGVTILMIESLLVEIILLLVHVLLHGHLEIKL